MIHQHEDPELLHCSFYLQTLPVGSLVLTLKAVDADVAPTNSKVIYATLVSL